MAPGIVGLTSTPMGEGIPHCAAFDVPNHVSSTHPYNMDGFCLDSLREYLDLPAPRPCLHASFTPVCSTRDVIKLANSASMSVPDLTCPLPTHPPAFPPHTFLSTPFGSSVFQLASTPFASPFPDPDPHFSFSAISSSHAPLPTSSHC